MSEPIFDNTTASQIQAVMELSEPAKLREWSTDELYEAVCRYLRIGHYDVKPVTVQRINVHYEPDASLFEIPRRRRDAE